MEHTSPKQTNIAEYTSNSRDRSNPGKSKTKIPKNNTLIRDFFSAAVKKGNDEDDRKRPAVEKKASDSSLQEPSSSKELDRIRLKCEELEQLCKDKDEQLKAVSNNQTILHISLRAALSKKEKELEELKKSKEAHATLAANVIEKLIRSDNAREMHELRHKLASDGARLGRIVYTRAGMRAVESWEEGSASKQLLKRRADLKAKRAALESRQVAAHRASKERLKEANKENDPAIALELIEAEESVRLHLDSLRGQEDELADEEQALLDEKAVHILSLKLVASEDASRFRSRPKVSVFGVSFLFSSCGVLILYSCL